MAYLDENLQSFFTQIELLHKKNEMTNNHSLKINVLNVDIKLYEDPEYYQNICQQMMNIHNKGKKHLLECLQKLEHYSEYIKSNECGGTHTTAKCLIIAMLYFSLTKCL